MSEETWPKYPFCDNGERVGIDAAATAAFQTRFSDWDAKHPNWTILWERLRSLGRSADEIKAMDVFRLRMAFMSDWEVVHTNSSTVQTFRLAEHRPVRAAPARAENAALVAMGILHSEPEISAAELARRVGVTVSNLYSTSPKWRPVREALLSRPNKGRFPLGYRDADGNLEAVVSRPVNDDPDSHE